MGARKAKRAEEREVSAELAAEIREALEAVERGETVDLGDFTQYADEDDCQHGCNGSPCGSERCTFICHESV